MDTARPALELLLLPPSLRISCPSSPCPIMLPTNVPRLHLGPSVLLLQVLLPHHLPSFPMSGASWLPLLPGSLRT